MGDALRRNGIDAVLTGGACASIHTAGKYLSADVDFILIRRVTQARLDQAMKSVGFERRGDRYIHPQSSFFVEFPRGPLTIGEDSDIHPVMKRSGPSQARMLSATDSCRDRLAAFFHWNDRQSLRVAIHIALRNRVSIARIQRWSADEGATDKFVEFRTELARARRARR